jgi:drug/metabolite transporter (DMT)-like permease
VGVIFVLIFVISGALNPVWIKTAYAEGATPLALVVWQGICAFLLYIVFALIRGREKYRAEKGEIIRYILLGALGMFLTYTLMNLSMERLQASYTIMLFFCHPAFVLLANYLIYKVRLHWLDIVTLLFILSGVYVLTRPQGSPGDVWGIILALGSGAAQAFYILYSGRVSKGDPLKVAFYAQGGCFAACLLMIPLIGLQPLSAVAGMKFGFILALVTSLVGTIFFLKGVGLIGSNRAALIGVTNLPLSLFLTLLILKEEPTGHLWGGFLLILAGLLVDALARFWRESKREHETKTA